MTLRALLSSQTDKTISHEVVELDDSRLPDGDVTVAVDYSSLNYKDGLVLTGRGRLVKEYPHVGGIEPAQEVGPHLRILRNADGAVPRVSHLVRRWTRRRRERLRRWRWRVLTSWRRGVVSEAVAEAHRRAAGNHALPISDYIVQVAYTQCEVIVIACYVLFLGSYAVDINHMVRHDTLRLGGPHATRKAATGKPGPVAAER